MAENRWAVVVGCNYRGAEYELQGCVNDAQAMKDLLEDQLGFKRTQIELLTDDTPIKPTGRDMWNALEKMVENAKNQPSGARLFFYFSGHGTKTDDGDEAIVCFDGSNHMTKYDFRKLVNNLPRGASFDMVSDSCHSGGLIDKETEQIGPSRPTAIGPSRPTASRTGPLPHNSRAKTICIKTIIEQLRAKTGMRTYNLKDLMLHAFPNDASLKYRLSEHELTSYRQLGPDRGTLLSGCQSDELSREKWFDEVRKHHGAFTYALIQMVRSKEGDYWCSNRRVVTTIMQFMEKNGFHNQHPCLYSSDANADAGFAGTIERECWKWNQNH